MHETLDPLRPIDVSRGRRLPHWFQPESTHSVTMRLKDSLPKAEGERWHANRCNWLRGHGLAYENPRWRDGFMDLPANQRQEYHHRFSEGFQRLLDRGFGGCALADPEAAAVLVETLHHFDGDRYHLGDYVVMPNHLHVLLTPLGDHALQAILTGWKRWSARQINLINGTSGCFWQSEKLRPPGSERDEAGALPWLHRGEPAGAASGDLRPPAGRGLSRCPAGGSLTP